MNTPLVTIAIITYNSSEFMLEALEYARKQTYQNIELIISDDHSKDNTVELCTNWLNEHGQRFARAELITTQANAGTSANLNRALRAAKGEWIKFIAGDDFLLPDCIEEFVKEVNANPEIDMLFCNMSVNGKETISKELLHFFSLDSKGQYKMLLKNSILPAPANFIRRTMVQELNFFDEQYGLFDDFPFFLKVLKSGHRFYHINKPLVYYRVHGTNVSHEQKINFTYYGNVKRFFQEVYLRELRRQGMYLHYIHYLLEYALLWLISKRIMTSYHTYSAIRNWVSPLHWQLRLKKRWGQ